MTSSTQSAPLATASRPWADSRGEPRLTVVAKGIFATGGDALHCIGPAAVEPHDLERAMTDADRAPKLHSDAPEAYLAISPSGLLVVNGTRAGAETSRSVRLPALVEAVLIARSGAELRLPLSIHRVSLERGAARAVLLWRGVASVRADELREIIAKVSVIHPAPDAEASADETTALPALHEILARAATPFRLAEPGRSDQAGFDSKRWSARGEGFPAALAISDGDETLVPMHAQSQAQPSSTSDDDANRTGEVRIADIWRGANAPFAIPGPNDAKASSASTRSLLPWQDPKLTSPVVSARDEADETLAPTTSAVFAKGAAPVVSPKPSAGATICAVPTAIAPRESSRTSPALSQSPDVPMSLRALVLEKLRAKASLQGLPLSGADLSGIDFGGALLSRLDMRSAKLKGAILSRARLMDTELEGADLTEALLVGADLSRANLRHAILSRACFDAAILSEASFAGAQGDSASFQEATGRRIRFAAGSWEGARFNRIDVSEADFSGTALDGADFGGARLDAVSFDHAHGAGASFEGAQMPRAKGQGAKLTSCSFKDADLSGSTWDQAILDGSTFAGANLKGASLQRASGEKAAFVNADLCCANLRRLVADGADFKGATLEASDLRQTRIQAASFEGANLRSILASTADLSKSRFGDADLSSANLREAKLREADFSGAKLVAADLRDADLELARMPGSARATAKLGGAKTQGLIDEELDAPNEV